MHPYTLKIDLPLALGRRTALGAALLLLQREAARRGARFALLWTNPPRRGADRAGVPLYALLLTHPDEVALAACRLGARDASLCIPLRADALAREREALLQGILRYLAARR